MLYCTILYYIIVYVWKPVRTDGRMATPVFRSISASIWVYISIYLHLYISLSLSLSIRIYIYIYIYIHIHILHCVCR